MYTYSYYNEPSIIFILITFITTFIVANLVAGLPLYVMAKRANLKNPIFAFIPVLNFIIIAHLAGVSAWKYLLSILAFLIPFIGFFISLGYSIYVCNRICKNFGLDTLGTVVYIFLPFFAQLYIIFTNKEFIGVIPQEYKN